MQSWCYRKANNRRGSETESSNAGVTVETAVTALSNSIWGTNDLGNAFFLPNLSDKCSGVFGQRWQQLLTCGDEQLGGKAGQRSARQL